MFCLKGTELFNKMQLCNQSQQMAAQVASSFEYSPRITESLAT